MVQRHMKSLERWLPDNHKIEGSPEAYRRLFILDIHEVNTEILELLRQCYSGDFGVPGTQEPFFNLYDAWHHNNGGSRWTSMGRMLKLWHKWVEHREKVLDLVRQREAMRSRLLLEMMVDVDL